MGYLAFFLLTGVVIFGVLWLTAITLQAWAEGTTDATPRPPSVKPVNGRAFNFSLVANGLVYYLNSFAKF